MDEWILLLWIPQSYNAFLQDVYCRPVVIKVDTGMSRNGCQVEELEDLVNVSCTYCILLFPVCGFALHVNSLFVFWCCLLMCCHVLSSSHILQYCDEHDVQIHSIMTHFTAAWDNPKSTTQQLDTFLSVTSTYRYLFRVQHLCFCYYNVLQHIDMF